MKSFKTLIVNTCDLVGGASLVADRLHKSMNDAGYEAHMLVHTRNKGLPRTLSAETKVGSELTKLRPGLDALALRIHPNRQGHPFTAGWLPDFKGKLIRKLKPDVVNIHWMGSGGMSIGHLENFRVPIFMTLHDSWSFTGGCHYHFDCQSYEQNCGHCPILGSSFGYDLSRWVWNRKNRTYKKLQLEVISPSQWLADCSKRSALLAGRRHHVIPNGVDHLSFKPQDKKHARKILGLPSDKKLILYRSQSSGFTVGYKGGHLLPEIFRRLAASTLRDEIELVSFGARGFKNVLEEYFPSHEMGFLQDAVSLSLLYSACDVLIMPSIQENFPLTILESFSCGTPAVAFSTGGIPEIIENHRDGHLSPLHNVEDFTAGILQLINATPSETSRYSEMARKKIETQFTLEKQTARHITLFQDVLYGKV